MARSSVPRLPQPPAPVSGPGPGTGAAPAAGPQPFDRRVILVGGIVFAVLMALSPRYGFHRDELYFLDSARHLQASYVDQPVLTPLLAWVSLKLFDEATAGHAHPALGVWRFGAFAHVRSSTTLAGRQTWICRTAPGASAAEAGHGRALVRSHNGHSVRP